MRITLTYRYNSDIPKCFVSDTFSDFVADVEEVLDKAFEGKRFTKLDNTFEYAYTLIHQDEIEVVFDLKQYTKKTADDAIKQLAEEIMPILDEELPEYVPNAYIYFTNNRYYVEVSPLTRSLELGYFKFNQEFDEEESLDEFHDLFEGVEDYKDDWFDKLHKNNGLFLANMY